MRAAPGKIALSYQQWKTEKTWRQFGEVSPKSPVVIDTIELKWTRQTHPTQRQKPSAHIVALSLEHVEEQGDAVLRGRHQLPDAVLVGRILLGPAWTGDGPIQLGDETPTGSLRKRQQKNIFKTNGENKFQQDLLTNLNQIIKVFKFTWKWKEYEIPLMLCLCTEHCFI